MDTIRKSLTNIQKNLSDKSNISNISNNSNVLSNNSLESIAPVTSIRKKSSFLESSSPIQNSPIQNSSNILSNFMDAKIITIIVLLIIILAILGFNLFKFLGEGTDKLSSFLAPLLKSIGIVTAETTKSTVSGVSDGSKKIITSSSDILSDTIDSVESGTNSGINLLEDTLKKNTNVVNTENDDKISDKTTFNPNEEPEPVKSNNQQTGYCYVGKINDTRFCAKVTNKSLCMSGDIYPTKDLCVNPEVRD